MVSGVSRNVVKIRLIRLGSCRSAIELRPQIKDLAGIRAGFYLPFGCHVVGPILCPDLISFELPPSNRLGIDDNEGPEHSARAFNINREAQRRSLDAGAPMHS